MSEITYIECCWEAIWAAYTCEARALHMNQRKKLNDYFSKLIFKWVRIKKY